MKQRRGITLLELIVVIAIFVTTMTAVIGIFLLARNAQEKGSTQSEAYRSVFVVLEKVETSLRGGQLLIPVDWRPSHVPVGTTDTIHYLYPALSGGRVVVDTTGTPQWAGRAKIEFQAAPEGRVLLVDETKATTSLLGSLGPGGNLTFLRTERDLLEVTANSVRTDPQSDTTSSYEFTVTLRLSNQP
ncbi:MAG: type II secretion system protein [Vulcanimicrobiota bacterium]